jgi:uncharacterized protein YlaI
MNIRTSITAAVLLTACLAGSAQAEPTNIFTRKINRAQDQLIFPNAKGEVIFSHTKRLKSLKEDQCILCHRIENPTLESIQTRFDNHRIAHQFCKGCHSKLAKGPTECHQCHNFKRTT